MPASLPDALSRQLACLLGCPVIFSIEGKREILYMHLGPPPYLSLHASKERLPPLRASSFPSAFAASSASPRRHGRGGRTRGGRAHGEC
eukprot:5428299-Pleurochrysis_carterae.AAC.1